jgi:hypothetical protein
MGHAQVPGKDVSSTPSVCWTRRRRLWRRGGVHHTRDQDTFPLSTRRCKAVVNHGTDGMGSHARERVIELSDFHCVVSACLVVVGHINPRCSRKKRTGEIRERNAGVSVPK